MLAPSITIGLRYRDLGYRSSMTRQEWLTLGRRVIRRVAPGATLKKADRIDHEYRTIAACIIALRERIRNGSQLGLGPINWLPRARET